MKKRTIAVLIPSHNEARTIRRTLQSVLKIVDRKDVYVVDDGSTDKTVAAARKLTPHVLVLKSNKGKATALNAGVKKFNLLTKYDFIMPIDADTTLDPAFFREALPLFRKKGVVCVIGKVTGIAHNWITSYRDWEYEVSQTIHKKAQSIEGGIVVFPGCSTVFRTSLLRKVLMQTGTLTEDMDLTFLIHRKRLGKIVFAEKARVTTQDPRTLSDYIKQIDRWYTGFWQCFLKHSMPWGGQMVDLEAILMAVEGLSNGLLMILLLLLSPYILTHDTSLLLIALVFDFSFFVLPTLLLVSMKRKRYHYFFYIPQYYCMRVVGGLIFIRSFFKVVAGIDLSMDWNKVKRYHVKEAVWVR